MPRFQYRALRPSGGEVAGEIVAESAREAALQVQASGSFPIEITGLAGAEGTARGRTHRGAGRLSARDLILFTRQLAALVGAGIAIDRALTLVAAARGEPRRARLAAGLLGAVNRGESLSRACAEHPALARHYAMVIAAGEAQGDVGGALERLSVVLERNRVISQSLVGALIYPASVLVVAMLSISFLMVFVVPRFESLLASFDKAPPLAMQVLLAVSAAFQTCALPGAVVLLVLLAFFLARRRDPQFRLALHRRLLRVPGIGRLIGKVETERLAFLIGNLVAAGVELPSAVAAAREAMPNEALKAALGGIERAIARGDGITMSFAAAGLLPDLALELVRIGEETGDLAPMLLKASELLRKEVEGATTEMIGLIAPISILVLGLLIGGIALALFGTVLQVYNLAT